MDKDRVVVAQLLLDGTRVKASFSSSGVLKWDGHGISAGSLIVQKDILGFTDKPITIVLHTFQFASTGCCGGNQRKRKDVTLEFEQREAYKLWCDAIQECLDRSGRPKRLVVFINPFSGKGEAEEVYKRDVLPLLAAARIEVTKKVTQFQLHARDMAKSMNIAQYDGVICVSGDGILVEVLNGLLERPDWARAIKMPIGVVPAGSGNGMAKSLLDAAGEPCNARNATFAIIRGHTQAVDVATVVQGQTKFYSILLLTWGFVADVDIESEKYRWMGGLRFDFYSLIRILRLRRYNGVFAYVPAPGYEDIGAPYNGELDGMKVECDDERRGRAATGYSGPVSSSLRSDWRVMEGAFVMVLLQNVPWASEDFNSAPESKFADGFLDLIVLRDCPRYKLIGLLTSIQQGKAVESKYLTYLKVKAFQIAPGGRVGSRIQGGYIDVDGEVVTRGWGAVGDGKGDPMSYGPTIEVCVEQGLATLYCPP
ncbi:sphingosine kinase 2 [Selaginella moellendorffii]|uniref:sphingosine kinase 2 n=1 Tax=Selaginella moellendorffii TaxID=88036 RepID=UPI000D1C8E0B|nr:sphingosine kinase 2 [Selaginella moellendorffii]XP_024541208.1 sphingosine kinase 2 [Selaginella moellendorffii]|eukprot:XP_024519675.1 sphingosine kinase 2 [Selaginella moellendorffii]